MSINRPYYRTCRQFVGGSYAEGGRSRYILHQRYAESPEHYVRAFLVLLEDMKKLFEFIEPADENLVAYSFRTHELLLRACVEFEANCKAILTENGYSKKGNWDISDYEKINSTHRLSSYMVKVPYWRGEFSIRHPFLDWNSSHLLPWYRAYNDAKHDRHNAFRQATFGNTIDAICGVLIVLSAQFYTYDFSPKDPVMGLMGLGDGMEEGIGGFFRVSFPRDWDDSDRYEFNWQELRNEVNPFQQYDYANINLRRQGQNGD